MHHTGSLTHSKIFRNLANTCNSTTSWIQNGFFSFDRTLRKVSTLSHDTAGQKQTPPLMWTV